MASSMASTSVAAAPCARRRRHRHVASSSSSSSVHYVEAFLDAPTLALARREYARDIVQKKRLRREKASLATGRACAAIAVTSQTYAALSSGAVLEKLRALTGDATLVAGDFPMEARSYGVGAAMDWHSDVALYEPAQWELIYTLENTSDSRTEWEVDGGGVAWASTTPGSALAVRANGPSHRVVASTRGERVIIKCLYVSTVRVKTEAFADALDTAPWRR
jgi:hypothetical protein